MVAEFHLREELGDRRPRSRTRWEMRDPRLARTRRAGPRTAGPRSVDLR